MPPSTSTLGDAQDALRALLDARPALSNVTIDTGYPGDVQREHIWIEGTVPEWRHEVSITGTSSAGSQREETFTMQVAIVVTRATTQYTEARDRALALQAEVEAVVRDNPRLGDTVRQADVGPISMDEAVSKTERRVGIAIGIECAASLLPA